MVTQGYPIKAYAGIDVAATLNARDYKGAANMVYLNGVIECTEVSGLHQLGQMDGAYESINRVYGTDGCSPTINTMGGENREPKIMEVRPTSDRTDLNDWVWEINGVKYLIRVRKLTPRECLRLMDFDDSDATAVLNTVSNTQAYKQAGNSICVGVLEHAYRQLFNFEGENTNA